MTPLTPAVMHVLLALAGGDRHGYGILKEVLRQTQDRVRLGPGTIYGTLQRLMESGWVEECEAPAKAADERRRYDDVAASYPANPTTVDALGCLREKLETGKVDKEICAMLLGQGDEA